MTRSNLICAFVIVACFNVALTAENNYDEYQDSSIQPKAVGRAYSLSSCNYKLQVGYSCLSCNRALHCYPGDIAILVDCYGIFRFCRDGRCSRFQGDKCVPDSKLTTPFPTNDTVFQTENIAVPNSTTKVVKNSASLKNTEDDAEIVTEKVAGNAFSTLVTETVIIPIDDTINSDATSDDASSNVV